MFGDRVMIPGGSVNFYVTWRFALGTVLVQGATATASLAAYTRVSST